MALQMAESHNAGTQAAPSSVSCRYGLSPTPQTYKMAVKAGAEILADGPKVACLSQGAPAFLKEILRRQLLQKPCNSPRFRKSSSTLFRHMISLTPTQLQDSSHPLFFFPADGRTLHIHARRQGIHPRSIGTADHYVIGTPDCAH